MMKKQIAAFLLLICAAAMVFVACTPEGSSGATGNGRPSNGSSGVNSSGTNAAIPTESQDPTAGSGNIPTESGENPTENGSIPTESTEATDPFVRPTESAGGNHTHSFSDWAVIREATCSKPELSMRSCQCGLVEHSETKPATDKHTYGDDGKCTECGSVNSSQLAFELVGETYMVTGLGTCTDKTVVIPETYQGLPVTKIKERAFFRESFDHVIIPSSVTEVGEGAFAWVPLQSIVIPSGIQVWGGEGFDVLGYCVMLQKIDYQGDLASWLSSPVYASMDRMPGYTTELYLNGQPLTDAVIPEGTTAIRANAFCGISGIQNVTVAASVQSIGANAFRGIGATEITFAGTMEAWQAMEKAEGWDGGTVTTVHCSDGDITV